MIWSPTAISILSPFQSGLLTGEVLGGGSLRVWAVLKRFEEIAVNGMEKM